MNKSATFEALSVAEATLSTLENIEDLDPESRPIAVLRTLIEMTRSMIEQGVPEEKIIFTVKDVADQIKRTDSTEDARRFVNRHLKKLTEILDSLRPSLDRSLIKADKRQRLRIKSSTQDKRKYLCLDTEPLEPVPTPQITDRTHETANIRYELFSMPKMHGLSKLLGELAMTSTVRWSFGLAPFVIIFLTGILTSVAVVLEMPQLAAAVIVTGVAVFAIVLSAIWPFIQASDQGIVESPFWLTPQFIDRTYLVVEPNSFSKSGSKAKSVIRIKSYTAVCPICEGKVYVEPGTKRHGMKGRFVGACRYSPEHIFTFDHMTLSGRHALS
ncbi:hypothetical protein [Saccharospirillum alexandrii]|uniref:hypothetical protein n=1 Tax=Saccharospirillum alexandrii TaxID=2448477 RepID=UPI0037365A22